MRLWWTCAQKHTPMAWVAICASIVSLITSRTRLWWTCAQGIHTRSMGGDLPRHCKSDRIQDADLEGLRSRYWSAAWVVICTFSVVLITSRMWPLRANSEPQCMAFATERRRNAGGPLGGSRNKMVHCAGGPTDGGRNKKRCTVLVDLWAMVALGIRRSILCAAAAFG